MADLACVTGVSRQTLYDRFGDTDGIMATAENSIADRLCSEFRAVFAENDELSTTIGRYYQAAIWTTYEIVRAMPYATDFERGMGPASTAAIRDVVEPKQAILTKKFAEHLLPSNTSLEQVARCFEQTSCQPIMKGMADEDLAQFLLVLKSSVLALNRAV